MNKVKSPIEIIKDAGYVLVVRCKDCRFLIEHYGFMNDGYCANMMDKYGVKFKPDKDWFCADGEKAQND